MLRLSYSTGESPVTDPYAVDTRLATSADYVVVGNYVYMTWMADKMEYFGDERRIIRTVVAQLVVPLECLPAMRANLSAATGLDTMGVLIVVPPNVGYA